jgi:hypothetical protein
MSPASLDGKYVDTVTIVGGVVTSHFSNTGSHRSNAAINGSTLVFSPTFTGGASSLRWTCLDTSTVNPRYLPTICRTGTN